MPTSCNDIKIRKCSIYILASVTKLYLEKSPKDHIKKPNGFTFLNFFIKADWKSQKTRTVSKVILSFTCKPDPGRPLKAPPANPWIYTFSVLKCNCRYYNAIVATILKKPRFATLGA